MPTLGETSPEWLPAILKLGENEALVPNLIRQLQTTGVIPFIGAGLSAPYNLPQWSELVRDLSPDEEIRAQVETFLKSNEYEGAAQLLMEVKGPRLFQYSFRRRFDVVEIDVKKETAMRSLARLRHGPIITTNFDKVLETVLNHEGCPLEIIVGEAPEKMSVAFQYDKDALLKIHGDIDDPAGRVLGAKEYDEAYARWLKVLLRNVATRCLLFLGCSLKSDRPVKVLAELVSAGHGLTDHYALLALPGTPEEARNRARQLAEDCRILPIWYPAGEHDYVRKILEYVASRLPLQSQRSHKQPLFRDIPDGRAVLFGRDPSDLMALIEQSRIVAVEGPRGVGKTSFALQALRRFMDRNTFGALAWITASARKEAFRLSDIFDAISLAIDFPFKPNVSTPEKESLMVEELKKRKIRCLLLLDNYETVADPQIEAFLFEPNRLPANLSVLITVTGRLDRDGVRPYRLEELTQADAAAMFRDRLARDQLDQESDQDIARLYDVVGGNPLAIEWVVGQMRAGAQLLRVLNLLEQGKADVLSRVFEQSWRQLNEKQQSLLTAFSIFMRPALEETLQAASGLDESDFHESLEAIMRFYLAKRLRLQSEQESQLTGTRYFVHPFARDFLEKLRTPAVVALLYSRVAAFYANYIPARGGSPEREEAEGMRELNGERENIIGVLEGCWKNGLGKVSVPIVEAMARWLFTESHWDDLERCGTQAVKEAEANGQPHAAARILGEMGRAYSYRLEFERAARTFQRALRLAEARPPDRWAIAYLYHHIGESLIRQSKFGQARPILQRSLDGFTDIGSVRSIIGVRYRMAVLAFESGRLAEATKLAERGVEDALRERWGRLEGFNRRLLGDIAVRRREPRTAEFHYGQALKLVSRTDMRIQALIELSLARLAVEDGNHEKAASEGERAAGHFEKLRMPREAEEARRIAAGLLPKQNSRAARPPRQTRNVRRRR